MFDVADSQSSEALVDLCIAENVVNNIKGTINRVGGQLLGAAHEGTADLVQLIMDRQ